MSSEAINTADIIYASFNPERASFAPYGLTCVHWGVQRMPRPDHHNEIELNFLTSGAVTYLLGSQKVTLQAGTLGIFWAANAHQIIDFEPNSAYFVATLPLHDFLALSLPEPVIQALMNGQLITENTPDWGKKFQRLFSSWEEDLRVNNEDYENPVLLEMQALLMRMGAAFTQGCDAQSWTYSQDSTPSKAAQMALFIAENYTQKISVATIADKMKLHPNYAMSLFQKTFGTTLVCYLNQFRIAHAQRLLSTTKTNITEVAYASGFQSISRFNSAFHNAAQCSPREYRQKHLKLIAVHSTQ